MCGDKCDDINSYLAASTIKSSKSIEYNGHRAPWAKLK